jgi:hypothetical protein
VVGSGRSIFDLNQEEAAGEEMAAEGEACEPQGHIACRRRPGASSEGPYAPRKFYVEKSNGYALVVAALSELGCWTQLPFNQAFNTNYGEHFGRTP